MGGVGIAFAGGQAADYRTRQIALALAFFLACLLLSAVMPRDRRSLFLLATFSAGASAFTRAALTGLPQSASVVPALVFRGFVPEAFVPAAVWEFAGAFPHVQRFTAFDVLARRIAGAAWLLGGALFGVNLAAAYHVVDDGPLLVLERNHPGNTFWYLFVVAMLPAVAAIFWRAHRASLGERRKVVRFAFAIAAGTAPFLVCGVLRMALPRVNDWFLAARTMERLWTDWLITGGLASMPALSTLAVVVDQPFDIHMRSTCDRLASAAMTSVVVAPFAPLSVSLSRLRHVAIGDVVADSWAARCLVACAIVGCLLARGRRLLTMLEPLGVRPVVDHQQRLAAALERVRLARGSREMSVVLSRELRDGVGAVTARVLVPPSDHASRGVGTFVDPHAGAGLSADTSLIDILRETSAPIDLAPEGPLRGL